MPENNEIILFGETNFRNKKVQFGIKKDDRRRHMYIIGKTGMGKTVLLENMAIQDIRSGHGVAIVDPHGEFAERMLDFVPEERINDVIYFNPADINYPIAFNVIEQVDVGFRHLVASGLMGVFKKIWPDVWSARMEYILHNTILALLEYPDSTLLGVNRMLADKDFRKNVVEKITDPTIKSFWKNEFAKYPDRFREEAVAPIQNKIGQFISAPLIRSIIGQTHSSFNIRQIMDEKKILIANLSKGKIGEDASRLLGALLITKLQLSAMSRVDVPEEKREDFYLYVDEFQNFATESFANILSEARKYRLDLVLAHQYINQMVDEKGGSKVRDAVFGNVGTIITFRVGAEDAEFLEKEFAPEFNAQDLVNLSKYYIYLKLMIDGVSSRAFSATTLKPFVKPEISYKDTIIEVARKKYATKREIIEEKIAQWSLSDEEAAVLKEDRQLYSAVCSVCGKEVKVPFKPDNVRPVYCPDCLKKSREKASKNPEIIQRARRPSLNREPVLQTFSLKNLSKVKPVLFRQTKAPIKKEKRAPDLEGLRKTLKESGALKEE